MKNILLKTFKCSGLAIAMAAAQPVLAAHAWTGPGTITVLEAGWAADTYSVQTTAPVINPAACTVFTTGYVTSPTDTGRKLYQDILRDAFWRNYKVQLLISGNAGDCPFGKPRIIAVHIQRP